MVAGVATEFEGAFGGQCVEDLVEGSVVKVAGGRDAQGAICGEDVGVMELGKVLEAWLEAAEECHLAAAQETGMAEAASPEGLKWVADGSDAAALGEMKEGAGDGREEVGVFVGVEVGDVDAGALEFLYLSEGFALDVVFVDVVAEECLNEVDEGGPEGFAVGTE